MAEVAAEGAAPSRVSLDILDLVKLGQAQNGLRHNDYSRYRQYCARRLTRIRHAPDIQFTFGKGKKFTRRELKPEDVTLERHLQIPLINAERAWATAMEEKSDVVGASTSQGRHRVLAKLKKAAAWAAQLRTLAAARADGHTALEAEAYAAWMRAQLALEQDALDDALSALVTARHVYEQLARVSTHRLREVFAQRLEEIAPQERQARYNLARRKGQSVSAAARGAVAAPGADAAAAHLDPALLAALSEGRRAAGGAGSSGSQSVFWRRTVIAVRSEALRNALLVAQSRSAELAALVDSRRSLDSAAGVGSASARAAAVETPSAIAAAAEAADSSEALYLDVLTKYDAAVRVASDEATRAARDGKPAEFADFKAVGEYCQFLKLRHVLDRAVLLYSAKAEAAMLAAQGAAPVSDAAGASTPAAGGGFVSQQPLLRLLATPPTDSAGGKAEETWGPLASQCAAIYTRGLSTIDTMAGFCGGNLASSEPGSSSSSARPAGVAASTSVADGGESLPVDAHLLAALAARRALLLVWRAWYLALALEASRRYADAAALLARAESRAAEAEARYASAGEVAPLPPTPVAVSAADTSEADAGASTGHVSHVLSGISAADLGSLAALRAAIAERAVQLDAAALLARVAPALLPDAPVRAAYAEHFAGAGAGAGALPAELCRAAPVPLVERLDPRRALAGGTLADTPLPLLAGPWAQAPLQPVPVPLKPIVLDLAFNAGVHYPDISPLLPAAETRKAALAPAPGSAAALPPTAAVAPVPSNSQQPAAAGGGGLLGWLTGR